MADRASVACSSVSIVDFRDVNSKAVSLFVRFLISGSSSTSASQIETALADTTALVTDINEELVQRGAATAVTGVTVSTQTVAVGTSSAGGDDGVDTTTIAVSTVASVVGVCIIALGFKKYCSHRVKKDDPRRQFSTINIRVPDPDDLFDVDFEDVIKTEDATL